MRAFMEVERFKGNFTLKTTRSTTLNTLVIFCKSRNLMFRCQIGVKKVKHKFTKMKMKVYLKIYFSKM